MRVLACSRSGQHRQRRMMLRVPMSRPVRVHRLLLLLLLRIIVRSADICTPTSYWSWALRPRSWRWWWRRLCREVVAGVERDRLAVTVIIELAGPARDARIATTRRTRSRCRAILASIARRPGAVLLLFGLLGRRCGTLLLRT